MVSGAPVGNLVGNRRSTVFRMPKRVANLLQV